jgi:exonuclease SbcC
MDASYKAMADKRLRVLLEKSQKLTFAQSMAEKELSRVQDSIEQKEQTLKHMRENVLTISDKMKELQKNLMVANASEVDQKKGTLSLLQNNKFVLDNSKKDMLVKLGAAQQQLLSITKERAECKADLEKLKLYETFASAFSKTGIPAMILKTQLPAINAEIAKILGGVVDFKIELEADINSNSMDVYIEDANSKRLIELASGMEKMISSLAIRIALINVSNLPRSDMFILDEGLGVLDQEGLQKCAELFNQIKTYFKTILIITHVDQIKEVVDKLLDIEDNGFESKIVV